MAQYPRLLASLSAGYLAGEGISRISDYYRSRKRPREGDEYESKSATSTSEPRASKRRMPPRRFLTHLLWNRFRPAARSLILRRYGRYPVGFFRRKRRYTRKYRRVSRRTGRRRFARRFKKLSKRRRISSFYKRVIKTSTKRAFFTQSIGNEDIVTRIYSTQRPCLLFQPHEVGQATGTDIGQNSVLRASQVVHYPMDYGNMENILPAMVAGIGSSTVGDNQRFLLDCTAYYKLTSMSNVPFTVDVIRWYTPRGIPKANIVDSAYINTYNLFNFFGAACVDVAGGTTFNATNSVLYGCEMIDNVVSNHNRITRLYGVKLKRKRVTLHPAKSIDSVIHIKEKIFNLYPWWYSSSATIGVNSRCWYIPPGSRGIFYIVRSGDVGLTLTANVSNTSYQTNSQMTHTTPAFTHHYQVRYGVRHIPETNLSTQYITDSGIAQPNVGAGVGVAEMTDNAITQGNAI